MIHEKISLSNFFNQINPRTTLTTYLRENSPEIDAQRIRPAVLICPGGGYCMTSDREAEPIALAFLSKGFHAFVLRYSTAPAGYPTQLLEVSAAMSLIRQHASKWNINADAIAVCGFSSGGHLVGSLGTLWNQPFISEALHISPESNKPNAMILSYPVISSSEYAHVGSFEVLLGKEPDPTNLKLLSIDQSVGTHTPPTFLWHTFEDTVVPVENSLLLATALKNHNIPFELHIYPNGCHGIGLADRETTSPHLGQYIIPHVSTWFNLCCEWLEGLFPIY